VRASLLWKTPLLLVENGFAMGKDAIDQQT
jgi:hypothetical protein